MSEQADTTKEIDSFFYDDPKIPADHWQDIHFLSEEECAALWQQYVSPTNRHFMLLAEDEWPGLLVNKENFLYNWQQDWNDDNLDTFTKILLSKDIPADSPIHFFWMKEAGITTKWHIFAKNWINFLYEDEGCIVVIPEQQCALVLSTGKSWFGKRSDL